VKYYFCVGLRLGQSYEHVSSHDLNKFSGCSFQNFVIRSYMYTVLKSI
jgi:hypothetical protein